MLPKRFLQRCIQAVLLIGALWAGASCQFATSRLIKPQRRTVHPANQAILEHAHTNGLSIEQCSVTAPGGIKLACLIVQRDGSVKTPPREVTRFLAALPPAMRESPPGSRGTVMLLHGFQNRKEQWLPFAQELAWAGFTCVLPDSRAHGESAGTYATFGHNEALDTKAVWNQVRQSVSLPNGKLYLIGYSMGGAVALRALDFMSDVHRVVTMSTFDRLDRVMWDQAAPRLRWLTRPAIGAVRLSTMARTGMDPKAIRPCDCVARHTTPLLIIHGAADTFVHPQASEVLEKSAKGPCQRILVPGKNHWSLFYDEQPALHAQIAAFLAN